MSRTTVALPSLPLSMATVQLDAITLAQDQRLRRSLFLAGLGMLVRLAFLGYTMTTIIQSGVVLRSPAYTRLRGYAHLGSKIKA
ncbi:hypothetical protein K438DRAFT_1847287 [Mycena galopus ATCC 62051]|nr:hypothetical protein K438DRAFT_1847287 [Mycena galopus ATCC 62051]